MNESTTAIIGNGLRTDGQHASQGAVMTDQKARRVSRPRESGFLCRLCGHCCLNLGDAIASCATEADIQRWAAAGRHDILEWVDTLSLGKTGIHDIWINPQTGEDASRCPWVRKVRGTDRYICRIHDLKPDRCRHYPLSRQHAEDTGCPGYECSEG